MKQYEIHSSYVTNYLINKLEYKKERAATKEFFGVKQKIVKIFLDIYPKVHRSLQQILKVILLLHIFCTKSCNHSQNSHELVLIYNT